MERVASGLFKGAAGIFILICGAVFFLTISAMGSIDGAMSAGILIPLVLIGWVLLRGRKSSDGKAPHQNTKIKAASVGDKLEGVGASIEVRTAGIAITRHGASSLFIHGLKGEKLLPFKSITAVQLKEPGRSMSGYIQFSLAGGIESGRGIWDASKDENTVLFTKENLSAFLDLRELVERHLAQGMEFSSTKSSGANDLATLAALLEAGHLTAQEFALEKAKILAR